jgi:hypothetical protein
MTLHSNSGKWGAGAPWYNRSSIIQRDNDGDGSTLDTDADDRVNGSGAATPDGTNDFDYWLAHGNNIEDPWLRYWVESSFTNQTCTGSNCQPFAWTGAASGNGVDHSNIFMNVDTSTFPDFSYQLWKNVAQSGAQNVYYYASDGAGTGTYKLNGSGASVSMPTATDGKSGVFFFDTATNTAPVDSNGDNSYDNLSDAVTISGGGYATTGFIFMNSDFKTTGNGSATNRTIFAPSEPYIDANGNGQYDSTEYFLDLTYPNSINGGYAKNGLRRAADGYTRQVPVQRRGGRRPLQRQPQPVRRPLYERSVQREGQLDLLRIGRDQGRHGRELRCRHARHLLRRAPRQRRMASGGHGNPSHDHHRPGRPSSSRTTRRPRAAPEPASCRDFPPRPGAGSIFSSRGSIRERPCRRTRPEGRDRTAGRRRRASSARSCRDRGPADRGRSVRRAS